MNSRTKSTIAIIGIAAFIVIVIACVVIALSVTGVLPATTRKDDPTTPIPQPPENSTTVFNIDLRFESEVSVEIAQAFIKAKRRWESIITNDIKTVVTLEKGQEICGKTIDATETVDDLVIWVNLVEMDGPGGLLAVAGPCGLDGLGRVRAGLMNFDIADIQRLIGSGRAGGVVLHEMGHVSHARLRN
jgi:hypothetical protein